MTDSNTAFSVRNYFQLLDNGQLALLRHFATPSYILHFSGMPEPLSVEDAVQLIGGIRAAFPDLRHHIEQIIERSGRVEVQITARGTQRGDFQGMPASGRAIAVPSTHTFRFENGQIDEHWIEVEMAEIMRQIRGGSIGASNGHAAQEANKALVRRLYDEVINQENKAVIDELFAPDVIVHDPLSGVTRGSAAFGQLMGMFDAAFPHHRVSVEQMLAEGDCVTVLHTHTATHTGPFMGVPPTGKSVVVSGIELVRVADGQIVEFWRKDDDVSLLMQLGMLAAPQPA